MRTFKFTSRTFTLAGAGLDATHEGGGFLFGGIARAASVDSEGAVSTSLSVLKILSRSSNSAPISQRQRGPIRCAAPISYQPARPIMIPGRRPTFWDSGGMAVPPFESQVCCPTVTLGRPGTGSCLGHVRASARSGRWLRRHGRGFKMCLETQGTRGGRQQLGPCDFKKSSSDSSDEHAGALARLRMVPTSSFIHASGPRAGGPASELQFNFKFKLKGS